MKKVEWGGAKVEQRRRRKEGGGRKKEEGGRRKEAPPPTCNRLRCLQRASFRKRSSASTLSLQASPSREGGRRKKAPPPACNCLQASARSLWASPPPRGGGGRRRRKRGREEGERRKEEGVRRKEALPPATRGKPKEWSRCLCCECERASFPKQSSVSTQSSRASSSIAAALCSKPFDSVSYKPI